jgi:hypothetical protein
MNMEECNKGNSHISSKLHMIYISSSNLDTLLLKPSLHFTTLHPTTLYVTTRVDKSFHPLL